MSNVMRGESYRTMVLCIDSYESGIPTGRIYSGHHESGQNFNCLLQMLLMTEQNLDEANYPQAFLEMRRFFPKKECISNEAENEKLRQGNLATFSIRILFRQNASWQGSVSWLEGNSEESFRSALELIFLINSALDNSRVTTQSI